MPNKLKIAHISAEVAPYSKSGGLSVVARSLSKAVKRQGQEVIVITPYYEQVIDTKKHNLHLIEKDVQIKIDKDNTVKVSFYKAWLMEGLPIYFIGNYKYFGKKKKLYGSKHENRRYYLFDLAAIKLMKVINWQPDVVHCHDWHSGLIPELLNKRYGKDPFFKQTASLYTIHNLLFQLGHNWWTIPQEKRDSGYGSLPQFDDPEIEYINFAKRAIIHADIVNAVSENYALEIMTKDYGEDLHTILKNRKEKLFGIVNGIDYDEYNPEKDPGLAKNYSYKKIHRKKLNKLWLQDFLELPQDYDIPIIGMVTRITEQKGFDLLKGIMRVLMQQNVQLAILGPGDKHWISYLKKIKKEHPKKLGLYPEFSSKHETSFYAGSDMFLMPSRFEPCGLGQMISLRYGSVPIVRATGGLSDTVNDFDPRTKDGDGFVFRNYSSKELLVALTRALETYKYPNMWRDLIIRGMKISHSWEVPAQKYITLYHKALQFMQQKND